MKKTLQILLTFVLVLSLGINALANNAIENEDSNENYTIIEEVPEELEQLIDNQKLEQDYHLFQHNNSTYLLITLGQRNTGGYSLEISNFEIDGDKLYINVLENKPAANDFVIQAITYPYLLIELVNDYSEVVVTFDLEEINRQLLNILKIEEIDSELESLIKEKLKTKGFSLITHNNRQLILITMGEKPSGGYDLEVDSVELNNSQLNLIVKEIIPEGPAITVLTYPYLLIDPNIDFDTLMVKSTTENYSIPYPNHSCASDFEDSLESGVHQRNNLINASNLLASLEIRPTLIDSISYIPLRKVAQAIGYQVSYNAKNHTIYLDGKEKYWIDLNQKTVKDENENIIDISLYIHNGTTMIDQKALCLLPNISCEKRD